MMFVKLRVIIASREIQYLVLIRSRKRVKKRVIRDSRFHMAISGY